MRDTAFLRSTMVGTASQLTMILVGHLAPALLFGSFFPIVGTGIGGVTGFLYGKWVMDGSRWRTTVRSAESGLIAGVIGSATSAGLGDVPMGTILTAGVATFVAGGLGGSLGHALARRS